ncbi:hypothetical protein BvCmsH35A_02350 [Escherichia coli]|nr:hypothetical protein BvCmsH35A_02350 [Escherichia coli]
MITVSSLKHSAKSEDSYAYDNETLHVRLRTLRGEVDKVILWIGDPYNWAEGGWICPYISRHLLSLNPLLACCRRYSRGER